MGKHGTAAREVRLSESALTARLAERFAAPEYAFIPQVRNSTGFSRVTRTADAVAMSLWPSRGLELHGFEIKSDRRDWVREKADPAKAEEIASFCDRWWLVCGGEQMVLPGELPATWGLIVPRGEKLHIVKQPEKLAGKPLDRTFVAALLRRAAEVVVNREDITTAVNAALNREREALKLSADSKEQRLSDELAALRRTVQDFEMAAGVSIHNRWGSVDTERVGKAVAWFLSGGIKADVERIKAMRHEVAQLVSSFDSLLAGAGE